MESWLQFHQLQPDLIIDPIWWWWNWTHDLLAVQTTAPPCCPAALSNIKICDNIKLWQHCRISTSISNDIFNSFVLFKFPSKPFKFKLAIPIFMKFSFSFPTVIQKSALLYKNQQSLTRAVGRKCQSSTSSASSHTRQNQIWHLNSCLIFQIKDHGCTAGLGVTNEGLRCL